MKWIVALLVVLAATVFMTSASAKQPATTASDGLLQAQEQVLFSARGLTPGAAYCVVTEADTDTGYPYTYTECGKHANSGGAISYPISFEDIEIYDATHVVAHLITGAPDYAPVPGYETEFDVP